MGAKVEALCCPNCGAALTLDQKNCDYCGSPVLITTFADLGDMGLPLVSKYARCYEGMSGGGEVNKALGLCCLKLKLYDKAIAAFDRAIDANLGDSEVYFYAAAALLKGKKPFLHLRPTIDKIVEYLNTAIMLEDRGIYHYFLAYIKKDYFARKRFQVDVVWEKEVLNAKHIGYTEADTKHITEVLGADAMGI